MALFSIRSQSLPQDQIEILVIDGGSVDATRAIAQKHGAVIVENPARLPELAKRIGLCIARGRYVMWQDSDELLNSPNQLEKRLIFLKSNLEAKCMVCDEQVPGNTGGFSTHYLCVCGDPFTQFVYRRKNGVIDTFKKAVSYCDSMGVLLHFKPGDLTPIGDGGTTMFDLDWVKSAFPDEWQSQAFACSVFNRICMQTGYCGCIPKDNIIHHARAGFKTYLSKLKFRVVNNVFHPEESGYGARVVNNRKSVLIKRKWWFIIYAVSIAGPVITSIRLSLRQKDVSFLFHFIYVYYVCTCVVIAGLKKLIGKTEYNDGYGKD